MTTRRNFIASIPMLSSIPFISKNVIKEEKRIIIENPKPIEVVQDFIGIDKECDESSVLQLFLVLNGRVVAVAKNYQATREDHYFYIDRLTYNDGLISPTTLTVTAQFDEDRLLKDIARFHFRK